MSEQPKSPSQLNDETLSTLREAITKLKSPECLVEVRKASPEIQSQWAKTLLKLDEARDELEKAELSQIRDKLKENENELTKGTKSVSKALETLGQIKQVLDVITAFVNIVAKVIPLAL